MHDIVERTMLLRGSVALPDGLELETVEFHEGWNLVQSVDARWLDKKIRKCGWHFIWIAEGSQRSGVSQTSQGAIASALKMALRQVSERYNAAIVEHIRITRYPWFFLAAVRIYTYQIQRGASLSFPDASTSLPVPPHARAASIARHQVFSSGIYLSH